jgi:hypothetical protein
VEGVGKREIGCFGMGKLRGYEGACAAEARIFMDVGKRLCFQELHNKTIAITLVCLCIWNFLTLMKALNNKPIP